jgi:predicted enzyme related to lactoylglutathione lyase
MTVQQIIQVTVVVEDYDDAIRFYTEKLNFSLIEDTFLTPAKRWVVVAPRGSSGCGVLLAKAANDEQRSRIGNQTGGRVFLFLQTNNFDDDYQNLKNKGVAMVREPVVEEYGTVAVFADLYGNLWDLIEPAKQIKPLLNIS